MKKLSLFIVVCFVSVFFYSAFAEDDLFDDFTGNGGNSYTFTSTINSIPKNMYQSGVATDFTEVLPETRVLYLVEVAAQGFNVAVEEVKYVFCERDDVTLNESCTRYAPPPEIQDPVVEIEDGENPNEGEVPITHYIPEVLPLTTEEIFIELEDIDPNMTCDITKKQAMLYMNGLRIFEFKCDIAKNIENHEIVKNPKFSIVSTATKTEILMDKKKVNDNAVYSATGFEIKIINLSTAANASLNVAQVPNRLLNGKTSKFGITIARNDKADLTTSEISLQVIREDMANLLYGDSDSFFSNQYTYEPPLRVMPHGDSSHGYYGDTDYFMKKIDYCGNSNSIFCNSIKSKYEYWKPEVDCFYGTCTRAIYNTDSYQPQGWGGYTGIYCQSSYRLDVISKDGHPDVLVPPVVFYNPNTTKNILPHLDTLSSKMFTLDLKISLPEGSPTIEFINTGIFSSGFTTPLFSGSGIISGTKDIKSTDKKNKNIHYDFNVSYHEVLRDGRLIRLPVKDFTAQAKNIGSGGNIIIESQFTPKKTIWNYENIKEENIKCAYMVSEANVTNHAEVADFYIPNYAWKRQIDWEDPNPEPTISISSASIDVYSSAAWMQTKGGNFGTNTAIEFTNKDGKSEANTFLYSSGERLFAESGDNFISATTGQSEAASFSPENQHNAEFFVYGEKTDKSTGTARDFSSAANWYYDKSDEDIIKEEFLEDPTQRYGFGRRGKEYQRSDNNIPRDYESDLLEREIFGRVRNWADMCDGKSVDECNTALSEFGGVTKLGNTFTIYQSLKLNRGEIYYIPPTFNLHFGPLVAEDLSKDILVTGGAARIHVSDEVKINTNILYGNNEAKSYLDIPNLRIEADRILVAGDLIYTGKTKTGYKAVEFIEAQMKAGTFSSGYSHTPLKILGDVIADVVNLQRLPSIYFDPKNFDANPPSELIIEDYRKYVVPVPGDTIIRDSFNEWEQVNPQSGESVDPF
ncbi:hypothetical protein COB57_01425 [Candidatus Peregrinibacteria bacterium]|nr:MAG: hypothetical protein COB57_01425 [Candidatus Peregrinibacteria bacterium]